MDKCELRLKFFKVKSLPSKLISSSAYLVDTGVGTTSMYVTSKDGDPTLVCGDCAGGGGVSTSANQVYTVALSSLGITSFDDITTTILATHFTGFTILEGVEYHFEVYDAAKVERRQVYILLEPVLGVTSTNFWLEVNEVVDASNVTYINGDFTNVQEAIDSLLYKDPVITSFTNDVNVVEKGTVVTAVKLDWTFNKPMTTSSVDGGIGNVQGMNTYTKYGLTLMTDKSYKLTVSDGTNTTSKTTSILFKNKNYFGTTANADLAALDISAMQNSEFADSRLQTRVISGGGEYMVFSYPASFGEATFNVNGLTNTAFTTYVKPYTNSKGFTENYRIYRTNTIQFGTLTIQVK